MARIYLDRRNLSILGDVENVSAEVERLLRWLEDGPSPASEPEYRPPLDVIETADAFNIAADLPGVAADAIRIVYTQSAVLIFGRKAPPACHHREAAFHLAERTFGRFACLVRLAAAVDAGRARATLRAGELQISLPRIADRRGGDIEIKLESN